MIITVSDDAHEELHSTISTCIDRYRTLWPPVWHNALDQALDELPTVHINNMAPTSVPTSSTMH